MTKEDIAVIARDLMRGAQYQDAALSLIRITDALLRAFNSGLENAAVHVLEDDELSSPSALAAAIRAKKL